MRVTRRIEMYIREAIYEKFKAAPKPLQAMYDRRCAVAEAIVEQAKQQLQITLMDQLKSANVLFDEKAIQVECAFRGALETNEEYSARQEEAQLINRQVHTETNRVLLALELNGRTADIEKLLAEIKVPGVE